MALIYQEIYESIEFFVLQIKQYDLNTFVTGGTIVLSLKHQFHVIFSTFRLRSIVRLKELCYDILTLFFVMCELSSWQWKVKNSFAKVKNHQIGTIVDDMVDDCGDWED